MTQCTHKRVKDTPFIDDAYGATMTMYEHECLDCGAEWIDGFKTESDDDFSDVDFAMFDFGGR